MTGTYFWFILSLLAGLNLKKMTEAVCREGLFLLPYNELAVAQGPKIYQKNEL